MRRMTYFVLAMAMVLGFTQCKKNEPINNNEDDGNRVSITLRIEDGGQKAHPEEENGLAKVVYDYDDVVYVGSNNGKYMGYLTYNGSAFVGSINDAAAEGEPLQFIFMGGQDFHNSLIENTTTEHTFNIGNQGGGLAVISSAASNESFSLANPSYTAYLRNQCALVKFDLGEAYEGAITLKDTGMKMKTAATIGFDGTVINLDTPGDIVTYSTDDKRYRYAVVLSNQGETSVTLTGTGYSDVFLIPAVSTNAFVTASKP